MTHSKTVFPEQDRAIPGAVPLRKGSALPESKLMSFNPPRYKCFLVRLPHWRAIAQLPVCFRIIKSYSNPWVKALNLPAFFLGHHLKQCQSFCFINIFFFKVLDLIFKFSKSFVYRVCYCCVWEHVHRFFCIYIHLKKYIYMHTHTCVCHRAYTFNSRIAKAAHMSFLLFLRNTKNYLHQWWAQHHGTETWPRTQVSTSCKNEGQSKYQNCNWPSWLLLKTLCSCPTEAV